MVYRYLHSHAYETLRDCRFKVSSPDAFNDVLDCSAKVIGEPSKELLQRLYGRDGGFIERAAQAGYSADLMIAAINSSEFQIPSPEEYVRVAKETLAGRGPIIKNVRILCCCDADGFPQTDRRMWNRYAQLDGVRLGMDFSRGKSLVYSFMRDVHYQDDCPKVDLSVEDGLGRAFDVERIVTTKTQQWSPEREKRLFIAADNCQHENGVDYMSFDPAIICRVDIGWKMCRCEVRGLIKMIRQRYPTVEIYKMVCGKGGNGIAYEYYQDEY